jgi:hypothetical protein
MTGAALLIAALLLAGQEDVASLVVPTPTPTPTPTSTPTPTATPEPGVTYVVPAPTPDRLPGFLASIERTQGNASERVALFDDGTAVRNTVDGGRKASSRLRLAPVERDALLRIFREALVISNEVFSTGRLVLERNQRVIRFEVAQPDGPTSSWTFDDMSRLPLPLGRAVDAMETLRIRLLERERNAPAWDPSDVRRGALLRRTSDGRWFRVVRDDSLSRALELEETVSRLERLHVARTELPRVFDDPSASSAMVPTP